MASRAPAFRFAAFQVDLRAHELRKNGHRIRLQEHPFKILTLLLERPGEIVTRDELRGRLWADGRVVDFENGLNAAIGKLRQALNDSAENPRYIATIPRLGYRFVGTLEPVLETARAPEAPIELTPPASHFPWAAIVAWAAVLAVALISVFIAWREKAAQQPLLVVLPFQNMNPGADDQYLADGVTEEMTTELARLEPQRLGVVARTSAMQYRNTTKSVAKIGEELGAGYLLEGSVRRSGDRVRVTAQLVRAADQTHLWAAGYDRDLHDVLAVEADVARAVAERIRVVLAPATQTRLSGKRPINPVAHEAYLRGRYLLMNGFDAASTQNVEKYLRHAIDIDPNFPAAYAALSEFYWRRPEVLQVGLDDDLRRARMFAAKALEIDETLPEAHMVMAAVSLFTRDWATADREFQRSLELDPGLIRARGLYAAYLLALGRTSQAIEEVRRAQQMDPLSPGLGGHVPRTLYLARHYREAIAECEKMIEMHPGSAGQLGLIAESYAELAQYPEAMQALERAGNGPLEARGYVFARAGRREQALKVMAELLKTAAEHHGVAYSAAVIYAGLGDRPSALTWLEQSERLRDPTLSNRLRVDPKLDSLRSEPRFHKLLARMNYPD